MQPCMVITVPTLSGYGLVLHVRVSVPLIPCLIDGAKYVKPEDLPPPPSRDLRRIRQGRRAPTLRSMVKLALQCESAEELGRRLLQRYGRIESAREAAETEARLDRLLAQD
jgi:hypothetical protein